MMGEYDAGYEKCIDSMVRQMEDMQFCIDNLRRENAKLRDEFRKMDEWHSKELVAAVDENDKLRELVRDYEHCTMYADCAHCKYDGKLSTHCPLSPCFPDTDELRELGVGVVE